MRDTMAHEYERSWRRLRSLAAYYVGDEAEDVVQEAFLRALGSGAAFRGAAAPATWLHRIVVNASIDCCRRRTRRERRYAGLANHAVRAHPAFEDTLALRTALRRLPTNHCRVLVMYDLLGHTHREIAARLGIPPGTSKRRLAEAHRRLRDALRDNVTDVVPA